MDPLRTVRPLARWARTLRALRPMQIGARPWSVAARLGIRDVSPIAAPLLRSTWPPVGAALRTLTREDAERALSRCGHLGAHSLLSQYERNYGFELLLDGHAPGTGWRDPVAVRPFPASVRARNLALASCLGRPILAAELARACRAVLLQLELHLLGNHLLENGFALACGGAAALGPEADLWWLAGRTILEHELSEQFLPDGGHFERTPSYHLWLTTALLETIVLGRAAGRDMPSSWQQIAARALGWAAAVRAPDGTIPLLNDASLDAAPSVDRILALGREVGIEPADVGVTQRRDDVAVRVLESTGWVLVEGNGAWLVVDAGPDGASYQPGHAHADALTFELWVDGCRVCVDYGVSSYDNNEDRQLTRATRSHNTVEIDGQSSSEVWGSFRVGRRSRGEILRTAVEHGQVRIDVWHNGYRWMRGGPFHSRAFVLSRRGLRVRDAVVGGQHRAISRVRLDDAQCARVRVCGEGTALTGVWYPEFARARGARVWEQDLGESMEGQIRIEFGAGA